MNLNTVSKTGRREAGLIGPEAFSFGYRVIRGTGNTSATISCTTAAVKGLHVFIQEVCVVEG